MNPRARADLEAYDATPVAPCGTRGIDDLFRGRPKAFRQEGDE